ncbi:hypothetical protein [Sulfuricurvum sp.]|uniref:hypothetical protein n=1 Tax=Sulfuricurvum sp. TaxID=2025608 RepID=UPI002E3103A8|nr:hypothetical protein [Sulfuricurvum sp.]HEX5330171.1 hypothetical protein [Sulfuricurvum sp.]
MKKFIFLTIMPLILWGTTYDTALLQIGSKMFPKIALMEKGNQERIQSSVNLLIVTPASNKESAYRLSSMIERQYNGTLSNYALSIAVVSPKEALEIKNAHGFVLLMESEDAMLPPVLDHAHKNKIVTFSFDPALLQKGVAVSLYIGRSVKPYINLSTLKQVPFAFEYGFLKLSQSY